MRPSRLSLIFVPALALGLACAAAAEVSVAGKIVDENGLAVAFARVELRLSKTAPGSLATADIAGGFTVQLASPGAPCLPTIFFSSVMSKYLPLQR